MTWDSFCQWWLDLFKSLGDWFTVPDASGYSNLARIIFAIIVIVIGHYAIKYLMLLIRKLAGVKKSLKVDISVKSFTISCVNIILNILLAIWVLSILNVNLTSVAGILSAGTVAIGLSLQNLISSFASGVVLLNAKHFTTGEYISIVHEDGECEGTVKMVNILSTTLDTFDNQKVVIPNDKVLKGVITNYSRNHTRRMVVNVSVDYSTDVEKCKSLIIKLANEDPLVLKSPVPVVYLTELGEYYLKFSLRCYVKQEDYWSARLPFEEKLLLAFRENSIQIPFRKVVIEESKGGTIDPIK